MHIFITGATGFIGPVIVELAVKQGHTVHGLSRSPKGDELLTSLGAVPIRGDLAAHNILREQSAKADAIFHLAFDHDFSKPYDQIVKLDTEAVDALATPLVGTSKPLIAVSGLLSVRPDPDGGVVDESAPYTDNKKVKRHVCEKHALSWAERGVRINVVRLPPYVYGRANETGFTARMVKMAVDNGVSGYIASVKDCCVSSVYVDDAAALFLLLASDKTVKAGEIFHGTGDWNTTYGMLAGAIGGAVGVPVRAFEREEAEERWGEFLSRFFGLVIRASNGKAVERLGWKPSGPSLVEELETGSYRQVAERFKQMKE
ncbi:NAD-dependent epimerase nscE [Aspergillus udagawae]|jgi:nucleoside-diphosphate-sugar epimerase|uniref:NAD-dependent epimerase/dehydratase domain-containing protein n=1 Tax=Aspergillus udagawae TaxID=91492 RepID=A0A8E0UZC9_9EURO|nr:uncharacterized protein Aud_002785 [Aspergillus udagawae]GIC86414.1 hypothetical protein Aud_002785 [Aspergillus udagawae]